MTKRIYPIFHFWQKATFVTNLWYCWKYNLLCYSPCNKAYNCESWGHQKREITMTSTTQLFEYSLLVVKQLESEMIDKIVIIITCTWGERGGAFVLGLWGRGIFFHKWYWLWSFIGRKVRFWRVEIKGNGKMLGREQGVGLDRS